MLNSAQVCQGSPVRNCQRSLTRFPLREPKPLQTSKSSLNIHDSPNSSTSRIQSNSITKTSQFADTSLDQLAQLSSRISISPDSLRTSPFKDSTLPKMATTMYKIDETKTNEKDILMNQTLSRNTIINRIIQKTKGKMRFLNVADSKKFDDKLKTFKKVSTFIDLKDQMFNLNMQNKGSELTQSVLNHRINNHFASRTRGDITSFGASTNSGFQMLKKVNPMLESNLAQILTSRSPAKRTVSLDRFSERMKAAKSQILKYKVDELDYTEKTDDEEYYDKLADDLVSDKLIKEEVNIDIDEDEILCNTNYLRSLLQQKIKVDLAMGDNYSQDFKKRADNIINVMRKNANRIYQKKLPKILNNPEAKEEYKIFVEERKYKHDMKEQKEILYPFEVQMHTDTQSILVGDIDSDMLSSSGQLKGASQRVNSLGSPRREVRNQDLSRSRHTKENDNLDLTPVIKNRKINALHRKCSSLIINNLNKQSQDYHDLKGQVRFEIGLMDELYRKDIEKHKDSPMDSLKVGFDTNAHFGSFMSKPIKRSNLNRRNIATFLGV